MTERTRYVEAMDRQLAEWGKTVETLRRKILAEPADKQAQLLEQIDFLDSARSELRTRVDSIRAFDEDQWKQETIAVDRTQHELKTALQDLVANLRA